MGDERHPLPDERSVLHPEPQEEVAAAAATEPVEPAGLAVGVKFLLHGDIQAHRYLTQVGMARQGAGIEQRVNVATVVLRFILIYAGGAMPAREEGG